MKALLTAAWVAPMTGAGTLRDGGVVHEGGQIMAVGPADALKRSHPDAVVEELGGVVLLPGLVNAHCHLELSFIKRPAGPITFTAWVMALLEQVRRDDLLEPGGANLQTALADCLKFGVTTVGDITPHPQGVRGAIALQPRHPRVVSYGEVRAMATRRGQLADLLMAATEQVLSPRLRIGVSPHAPYSVEPDGYRECLAVARRFQIPLATHLAETPDEALFLATHGGPLRELWNFLGGWDDRVPRFDGGPVRYAKHLGLLHYERTCLAHVNYCDDEELAMLAKGRASVAYCPRTHRYFGHPPHRWREMLAAGMNVAVGTDSTASAPDLNVVDDLRLLHEIAPDAPVEGLWEMATVRAARAVGRGDEVGTLEAGKAADLVAFASGGEEPLREVLEAPLQGAVRVWVGGAEATPGR